MDFPVACQTDEDRINFCYRSLELLRLLHNTEAKKQSLPDFRNWQEKEYKPRMKNIYAELNELRETRVDADPDTEEFNSIVESRQAICDVAKSSTEWDNDIDVLSISNTSPGLREIG